MQDIYLKALKAGNVVGLIEYGHYVARVKTAPLATPNKSGKPDEAMCAGDRRLESSTHDKRCRRPPKLQVMRRAGSVKIWRP